MTTLTRDVVGLIPPKPKGTFSFSQDSGFLCLLFPPFSSISNLYLHVIKIRNLTGKRVNCVDNKFVNRRLGVHCSANPVANPNSLSISNGWVSHTHVQCSRFFNILSHCKNLPLLSTCNWWFGDLPLDLPLGVDIKSAFCARSVLSKSLSKKLKVSTTFFVFV